MAGLETAKDVPTKEIRREVSALLRSVADPSALTYKQVLVVVLLHMDLIHCRSSYRGSCVAACSLSLGCSCYSRCQVMELEGPCLIHERGPAGCVRFVKLGLFRSLGAGSKRVGPCIRSAAGR